MAMSSDSLSCAQRNNALVYYTCLLSMDVRRINRFLTGFEYARSTCTSRIQTQPHWIAEGATVESRIRPPEYSVIATLLICATLAFAQSVPAVTGDARVDKLLSQMTLEEKLKLIHGTHEDPAIYQGQAGYLGGIPRLNIPGLRFADGPPGVLTRHRSLGETATMGVAATFSRKTAEENGLVIGREGRALGIDVSLQPFVNIDRDLQFERGYNTFGEDPFLTSEMAVAEVKGIQSQRVMAQIKHYVAYDSESGNIFVDDQTLHEVYVAPFDAAIRRAGVSSIMCSYNRVNGTFACGNESTLTKILRDEIGFKGFVTSDWGAVHGVKFINSGLDMEMPGEPAVGGFQPVRHLRRNGSQQPESEKNTARKFH
jgi:beta-glucosidase